MGCFPAHTFDDSSYWVTPLWAYKFSGFSQPVDNGQTWDSVQAGSAVPVRFSLGGYQGLHVIKSGYPRATQVVCPGSSVTADAIEHTTTVNDGLTYDASADRYTNVWNTSKAWAGKCFRFELGTNDDTSHSFYVKFKRAR
jgi:hypothetical protein